MIATERLAVGLVAVLCVHETCRTVKLRRAAGKPRPMFARRPQRALYYYWLDEPFGLLHLRLQTWFPYTLQVHVNGQRQLSRGGPADLKKHRFAGARVKHRMKENWLKMYDKFALLLRVETVINNPREFKVRRRRWRDGVWQMRWCPMNKGVANLPSYQRVARASNERYQDALSVVADPTAAYREVAVLAESKQTNGRRYAGFNPARRDAIRCSRRCFRAIIC
jgi:hypothetical protein